jgi:copper oxidase (laccase) domain-containing protein
MGVPAEHITISAHCTRCGEPDFFSHRGGSKERQMGILGMRALD